jgi:hypothetical protein
MLNPKDTLKSIKALLSSEVVSEEVIETPVEEVALEEVKEEAVAEVALEDAPVEEAPAEEEAPKDEFVSIAVFEEAISMLIAEVEALKGGKEDDSEMTEEVKEEELSAEVVAEEETTELSVHNPEVQQVKLNSNRPLTSKESVWNIINNK